VAAPVWFAPLYAGVNVPSEELISRVPFPSEGVLSRR
jgi:hypothetical protein